MAFTFDATVKGETSNSYVTVEEADDYFAGHLKKELWEGKTTEEKEILLVSSTMRLEREPWAGRKTTSTQALQWPRAYVQSREADYLQYAYDSTVFASTGEPTDFYFYMNSDTIPTELKQATCEIAIWNVIKVDEDPHWVDEYNQETLDSITYGPITASIKRGMTADRLPTTAERLLNVMSPNAWQANIQPRLVRG